MQLPSIVITLFKWNIRLTSNQTAPLLTFAFGQLSAIVSYLLFQLHYRYHTIALTQPYRVFLAYRLVNAIECYL